jgi:hypothetical protein
MARRWMDVSFIFFLFLAYFSLYPPDCRDIGHVLTKPSICPRILTGRPIKVEVVIDSDAPSTSAKAPEAPKSLFQRLDMSNLPVTKGKVPAVNGSASLVSYYQYLFYHIPDFCVSLEVTTCSLDKRPPSPTSTALPLQPDQRRGREQIARKS